jgi:hypothetical protein
MPPEELTSDPPQSSADRLLRAQAAELEALRQRVADVPDPDSLLEMRAKAEKFDQLQADLPNWQQQLQTAHQQERQTLEQRVQQQEADLQRTRLSGEMQAAFLQAGGNPQHFAAWQELYGSKYVKPGEDGALMVSENGQTMPLADVLANQRTDSLYGVLFHPRYGSGSGGRSGHDRRLHTVSDLQNVSTSDLFRQSFGSRRK